MARRRRTPPSAAHTPPARTAGASSPECITVRTPARGRAGEPCADGGWPAVGSEMRAHVPRGRWAGLARQFWGCGIGQLAIRANKPNNDSFPAVSARECMWGCGWLGQTAARNMRRGSLGCPTLIAARSIRKTSVADGGRVGRAGRAGRAGRSINRDEGDRVCRPLRYPSARPVSQGRSCGRE